MITQNIRVTPKRSPEMPPPLGGAAPQPQPMAPAWQTPPAPRRKGGRGFAWLLLFLLLLGSAGAVTWLVTTGRVQIPWFGGSGTVYTVAVGTIADNGSTPPYVSNIVNDVFYSSLEETKKFKLVERSRLADLAREAQRFAKDDAKPVTAPKPAKAGEGGSTPSQFAALLQSINKAAGELESINTRLSTDDLDKIRTLTKAEYFLVGVISDFYSEQGTRDNDALGRTTRRSALSITLDARVVNTRTGEILCAPTVHLEEPGISGSAANPVGDRLQKLEIELARTAARKLSAGVVNALYPISVASVAGGKVYLNRGTGLGVSVGDTYTVYNQGKAIIDPDTKKEIGHAEEPVGDIVVTEAMDRMAIASPVNEGLSVKAGMIARPNGPRKSPQGQGEITPVAAAAAAAPSDGRKVIAILPLRNTAEATDKAIDDLQTIFNTELGQYPEVRLIERQQLDKIGKELDLADQGYVSPQTAIKVGQLTGAKYCLVGSLMRLKLKSTETALRPDLAMTRNATTVELDCRLLETARGEVQRTASVVKTMQNENDADDIAYAVMRQAVREACQKLMGPATLPAIPQPEVRPIDSRGVPTRPVAAGMPAESGGAAAAPEIQQVPSQAAPTQTTNPEQKFPGSFLVISRFADATGGQPGAAELCQLLDSNLQSALAQTKRIPVVERADDRYLDEMVFARKSEGFIDPATIPKTGKLIGSKYYLATQIVRYAPSGGGGNTALPNVYENSWDLGVEVNAKLLEIETGRILETFQITKSRDGSYDSGAPMRGIGKGQLSGLNAGLAREVAGELTDRLLQVLFPVLVADISESEIYLNQGESTGLRPGLKFTVYNPGREITDPTTGRVIGRTKTKVGVITVSKVERELALAVPEAPATLAQFTKGMVCEFERAEAAPARGKTRGKAARPAGGGAAPEARPVSREEAPPAVPENGGGETAKVKTGFAVAPVANSTDAPNRALKALRDGVRRGIQTSLGASVVTRDEDELAEIGREYLRGKSRLMDSATRLKAVKLAGCRYLVTLEVTDWVSKVSSKPIPMTNESIDIQEVLMRVSGSVLDLQTGKVVLSSQAKASTADEGVDANVVVDGQGDLDKDAKIAEKAAGQFVNDLRQENLIK